MCLASVFVMFLETPPEEIAFTFSFAKFGNRHVGKAIVAKRFSYLCRFRDRKVLGSINRGYECSNPINQGIQSMQHSKSQCGSRVSTSNLLYQKRNAFGIEAGGIPHSAHS